MTTAPKISGRPAAHFRAGAITGALNQVAQGGGRGIGQGRNRGQDAGGVGPAEAQGMPHRGRGGAHPQGAESRVEFQAPPGGSRGICPANRATVAGEEAEIDVAAVFHDDFLESGASDSPTRAARAPATAAMGPLR